jgi:hypothetical protein
MSLAAIFVVAAALRSKVYSFWLIRALSNCAVIGCAR